MSTTVETDNQKRTVASVYLDPGGDRFALCSSAEGLSSDVENVMCYVDNPLLIPRRDASLSEYRVALFIHRHWPESQVVSLRDKKSHYLGKAFSLEALSTDATTLLSDEFDNAFGYFALQKLCLGEVEGINAKFECRTAEAYSITKFFPEDTIVAIFLESEWHSEFPEAKDFRDFLYRSLPSFVPLGLYLQSADMPSSVKQYPVNTALNSIFNGSKQIRIRKISSDFPAEPQAFLLKLLSVIDPFESHPVFRFFLFYQLFELLMQSMYENYLKHFRQVADLPEYANSIAMKDLIDALTESLREASRLKKVFEANPEVSAQAQQFRSHCTSLLLQLGLKEEGDPALALYRIRNLIFHAFRSVDNSSQDMSELVDQLMILVCELSFCFRNPTAKLPGIPLPSDVPPTIGPLPTT
jgi:hypothetical protein